MKENIVEEMKQILIDYAIKHDLCFSFEVMRQHAEVLYKAGYRKMCNNEKQVAKTIYNKLIELSDNPCNSREEIYKEVFEPYGVEVD